MGATEGAGIRELQVFLDAIAAVAVTSYHRPVAACPGWEVADLVTHIGRVHRWAAAAVGSSVAERARFPVDPELSGDALRDWYLAGATDLVDRFTAADLDREAWTFAGPQRTGWWLRRQVHESAIHAWDAQSAAGGRVDPLPLGVAVDGIDEYVDLFLPRLDAAAFGGAGEVMLLHAIDAGVAWRFHFDPDLVRVVRFGSNEVDITAADAAATGTAAQLGLFVWSRIAPADLTTTGDTGRLARFQDAASI